MSEIEEHYVQKLSNLLDMSEADEAAICEQFLSLAKQNPDELVALLHSIDLTSENYVWEIYHSLSKDPAPWRELILAEIPRLIAAAVAHPEAAKDIFNNLDALSFYHESSYSKEILQRIREHVDSPNKVLRTRTIFLMGNFTDDFTVTDKERLQDLLVHDPDWRIRNFARYQLIDCDALPNQYSEPILDRIRRKLFNQFQF